MRHNKNNEENFQHPHDTPLSSGLRFLSEIIAWVAGPWAVALVSQWLIVIATVAAGLPRILWLVKLG